MSNQTGTEFYQARVEVLIGNRVMSDFIASAGLGLTGVGTTKILVIDYKPGEQVDECRRMKQRERDDWQKLIKRKERGWGNPGSHYFNPEWRDYKAHRVERTQAVLDTNQKVALVMHLQRKGLLPKDCEVAE